MKKYIFILLALVLAVSCKDEAFLEEKTYNDDTGSFFTNQKSIEIALASAYAEKPFNTLDDVKSRTRLTGTNIDDLKKHGLFSGLPESAQISIFDL